jgi:hypothetical protein
MRAWANRTLVHLTSFDYGQGDTIEHFLMTGAVLEVGPMSSAVRETAHARLLQAKFMLGNTRSTPASFSTVLREAAVW